MSRGLGWVQRAILEHLGEYEGSRRPVHSLAAKIYHPEWFKENGDYIDGAWWNGPTHKEVVAVSRAVKALERRGLVTVRRGRERDPITLRGDARLKWVSLSVE